MTQMVLPPTSQRAPTDKPFVDQIVEIVPFQAKDSIKLSVRIVREHLVTPTKSGKMPTDSQVFKFIMLCRARALNPWEGDAFLVGYDGKDDKTPPSFSLITAHQAFLKRAEVHQEYDGMRSGVIVSRGGEVDAEGRIIQLGEVIDLEGDFFLDTDFLLGGWATVYFKNRKIPKVARLKLSTFNTGYSRWQKDPAGMICKCAEADALRSSFPTTLAGMYLEQELAPEPRVVNEPPAPPVGRQRATKSNGHQAPALPPMRAEEIIPAPPVREPLAAEQLANEGDSDRRASAAETQPAEPEQAPENPEADTPTPGPTVEQQAALADLVELLGQKIDAARLGSEFNTVWDEVTHARKQLGEGYHDALMQKWKAAHKAIIGTEPAAGPKKGKK